MPFREIIIGNEGADFVGILPMRPGLHGWFTAKIRIRCEGFEASFNADFMKGELERFAEELHELYKKLKGEAVLDPIEPRLKLFCTGDGKGHVRVRGEAEIRLGSGTFLTFSFHIDQTYIPQIVQAIKAGEIQSTVHP